LDLQEATTLLNELVAQNLAHPSYISVEKNDHGTYNISLKTNSHAVEIRAFLADKNLILSEDKEKRFA